MEILSPNVTGYFRKKITEVYGSPEIRKVPAEPRIEWTDKEVPYTVTETYTEKVDAGLQPWVYSVAGALAVIALIFFVTSLPVAGIAALFAGVAFFAFGKSKFRQLKEVPRQKEVRKTRMEKIKIEIPQFREEVVPGQWSITNMGTGSLQFGVATVNQVTFLSGRNFSKPLRKFRYPVIRDEKKFIGDFNSLESKLGNIPYVLNGEKSSYSLEEEGTGKIDVPLCGMEKEIMDHFLDTGYLFSSRKATEISASLVHPALVRKYLKPARDSFSLFEDDFLSLVQSGEELEAACNRWLSLWPGWMRTLENFRFDSVTQQVLPEFTQFSNQSQYSSFNFYCPDCNKELSDELLRRDYSVHNDEDLSPLRFSRNTRCHFILGANAWQCPMCSKISMAPIPLHKSLDEILLPVYNNLMQENKNLREQDYSDVRRKEIHYKNEMKKETESMYFENLNSILALKDDMERMQAEIDGETEAISFINDTMTRYKNLQSDILSKIEDSNIQIKKDIDVLARKILADVDKVKDREMELLGKELHELSKAKRIDDERRDAVQRNILTANQEQNKILNEKFTELISTNKEGFSKVTGSINSLENTTKHGLDKVASGIDKLDQTTKEGFAETVKSSKDVQKEMQNNNAMLAAQNKEMGIDLYDDSFLLHPGRSVKRGLNRFFGTITGKSSHEIEVENQKTFQ